MEFKVKVTTIFQCSLERAFKTPMLCDVSKIHTGYGLMPRVTHCTEDERWGQVGESKKVFVAASPTQKGGFASRDTVLERIENRYWKIKVDDFQAWMLGFYQFIGEWETLELAKDQIQINYTYTLYTRSAILSPLAWLFARLFWKTYMKKVLENVRQLAYTEEPYKYS
ncbi:MAG: hypothetical protein K1X68_00155 [Saprospiraceae bacterium]|nr:hypothetical protein [Saprospiraceae bacterium]HMW39661.1 hypothetical protein [Saprospiraceae bacterium]HMX88328.1 hypothetical protein [Saprospiraceae bacterium]HMZ40388.1 hypothetical protein [Saprospiraceae bacterium]HNA65151.1 hypothetical protein [Saprospiraceae bacterium]